MRGIELTPEHPVERLLELGTAAERAGFDTLFTSCHYNNRDPFIVLSQLAQATDDIGLGPGVCNPYEVHPVRLASTMATLAEASGGRAVFGIGPGDPSTLRNLDLADRRGLQSVLEAFTKARQLWDGERINHDGTFTAMDAALNYTTDRIPVYVGGEGPQMCRMAATHADGLLFNGSHPDDLAWAREQIDAVENRAISSDFEFVAYATVSIAADGSAAREAARPPVAFITAGAPEPTLSRHGIDPKRARMIGDRISAGEFSTAFEAVTESMIDAFCIAGTPDIVEHRMAQVLEQADGIVVSAPLGPDVEEAIELAAKALTRAES